MFKEGAITPKEAYVKKGAITLEGVGGEEIALTKVDVVIMNPPFTRQERLPKDYKASLVKRLRDYKGILHAQLGFYGYFLPLADSFLKDNGRIAFVLPATILRIKSTENIRKFLLKNYQMEFILTTLQRAAFSEGAQFREILLVAKKSKRIPDNKLCTIVNLKKIPQSLGEAIKFSHTIKEKKHTVYEDENMRMFPVSTKDLRENVSNWFAFVAVEDANLFEVWKSIREKTKEKMISLTDQASKVNATPLRFDLSHVGRSEGHGFILKESIRAKKSYDRWIISKESPKKIVAVDRATQSTASIPRKALEGGLRRASGTRAIDVSDIHDYIVVSKFPEIQKIIKNPNVVKKWKAYVKKRKAHLLLAERFDISAPGTFALAFYSDKPIVGAGTMCCFKDMPKPDAKIISLWLNSTLNLLQIILKRKETRGAWMRIHHYMFDDLSVINPMRLGQGEKKLLYDVFEKEAKRFLPSILEQLKSKNSIRVSIDEAFLKVLGFTQKETKDIVDYLYPALANEIEKLKTLMEG